MPVLAPGLGWVDLKFRGSPNVIGTAVVSDAGGVALIDPGPTSCLETLELGLNGLGIRLTDVTHVLLTHVHLDHAGATGTLVRRVPSLKVFVHERGAPHLVDPTRLVRSATRLWGDQMPLLWGEVAAVPASSLVTLRGGGDRVEAAGRAFDVAYTPGHASHHVSFFDRSSGVAFVGDVAGIRIRGDYVRPPTPPPDIDVELWIDSAARVERWDPATMFLTHFGPSGRVRPHLQSLIENLRASAEWVRVSLSEPGTDEERAQRYAEYVSRELRRHLTEEQILPHHVGAPFEVSWLGLARYWRKKGGSGAPAG
ncbi:MAG TPA: MBL fold metallo-hydrolase [Vicinamibacterales bacterium]|nr:MBL fold metallo-hydrolase [Vicinamibacterales bacterium]